MIREKRPVDTELSEAGEPAGSETGELAGGGTGETADNETREDMGSLEAIAGQKELETIVADPADLSSDAAARGKPTWIGMLALAAVIVLAAGSAFFAVKRKKGKKQPETMPEPVSDQKEQPEDRGQTMQVILGPGSRTDRGPVIEVGRVHHIGRRQVQQDSLGVTSCLNGKGLLAVVADGMGGLSDGDKVSQRIVLTMLQDSASLAGKQAEGALYQMLAHVNREVNSMLGTTGRYKSGSTVVAVMVEAGYFQWISVGDSRLYLYRGHHLFLVNREHIHEVDLWKRAVVGEIAFSEIAADPQRKHISSFIGMGELRYIDGSIRPVPIYPGDKLLLMSDGVFNTLSEQEIRDVLLREGTAQRAAQTLESLVLARQNPRQDNFTAVILDI